MTFFENLMIAHFIGDWILQPSSMGIQKSSNWKIRFLHCLIYTACFFWLNWIACFWIFITHFIIDSYMPLFWFRKSRGDFKTIEEFKTSFNTPAGFFINVVLDQIFHIITFLPVILSVNYNK
jgi:hypothetical protein